MGEGFSDQRQEQLRGGIMRAWDRQREDWEVD